MAKVLAPLMSLAVRGKEGGIVFNTWRGINTAKSATSPVQPNSSAQLDIRDHVTTASRAWASLSNVQRTGWNDYANAHTESDWTGAAKRLTGQNWYVRCAVLNALCGAAAIAAAPAIAAPASITGAGFAYVAGPPKKITLTWSAPVAATSFLQIKKTPALSTGEIPKIEKARGLIVIGADTASPYDVVNPITAGRYGFWVRTIDTVTGLASPWTGADLTVT